MEFLLLLALPLLFGMPEGDGGSDDKLSPDTDDEPIKGNLDDLPEENLPVALMAAAPLTTAGNDVVSLTNAAEYLDGLAGDDSIFGHNSSDTLIGSAGHDTLSGGDGGDLLDGVSNAPYGDGPDLIYGGKGVDVILGNNGDTLYGGEKDDGFVVYPGGDPVVIGDFMTEGQNPDPASDGDTVYLVAPDGVQSVDLEADLYSRAAANGVDAEVVMGSQVVAIIKGGAGHYQTLQLDYSTDANPHWGGAGNDTVNGGNLADFLYGGDADDLITARAGNDFVHDGFGNDVVNLGAGNDVFYGGEWDNSVPDNDLLSGGRGDDRIYSGLGADTINGEGGNDWIDATEVEAQTAPHADRLSGGIGDDTLIGDAGDRMAGGSGADEFRVLPGGLVTVPDFDPAEDELVLHVARTAAISLQTSGTATLVLVDGQPMVKLLGLLPPALSAASIHAA